MNVAIRIFFLLLFSGAAFGQRKCLTYPGEKDAGKEYRAGGKIFEKEISRILRQDSEKSTQSGDDSIYYIPVVVHVLHNGEPIGTGRNISMQRIQSQIDILNQDFGRQPGTPGFNEHPAGVDTRIRFCLASNDTSGNPTDGVVRVNTGFDAFDLSQNDQLKSYSLWDPMRYLNIWVCKLQNNYIGYAQYPIVPSQWSDSLPMITNFDDVQPDGVVIEYRVFGNVPPGESGPYSAYNKGRTATHEIGHYLGLIHIWGDGNTCADNKTDFCSDTPPQATATSGCPASPVSCTPGILVMKENYMDYTNDACMNIFTLEQKKRMRIVLRNCIRRETVRTTSSSCTVSSVNQEEPEKAIVVPRKNGTFSLRYPFASDKVTIVPEYMQMEEVSLCNLLGREFAHLKPAAGSGTKPQVLPITTLPAGLYIIRVTDSFGQKRSAAFRHFNP